MIITCIRCKKDFESTGLKNRICADKKCHPPKPLTRNYISYDFWNYMSGISRYFQNSLYQFYRLQHDEELNQELRSGFHRKV